MMHSVVKSGCFYAVAFVYGENNLFRASLKSLGVWEGWKS